MGKVKQFKKQEDPIDIGGQFVQLQKRAEQADENLENYKMYVANRNKWANEAMIQNERLCQRIINTEKENKRLHYQNTKLRVDLHNLRHWRNETLREFKKKVKCRIKLLNLKKMRLSRFYELFEPVLKKLRIVK